MTNKPFDKAKLAQMIEQTFGIQFAENPANKHKKYLILDTETTGSIENPHPYDIGWVIADRYGNIYGEPRSFIVWEVFTQRNLMDTAHYKEKIPKYNQELKEGKREMRRVFTIRQQMLEDMEKWGVDTVGAYNMGFDKKALNNLMRFNSYGKYKHWFRNKTHFICLWNMACQTIATQTKYSKFCIENGFVSPSGNIQTSAETVYRFMLNDPKYVEEHTGLEDVLIEVAIMRQAYRQKKAMKKGINSACWRVPQPKAKEIMKKIG